MPSVFKNLVLLAHLTLILHLKATTLSRYLPPMRSHRHRPRSYPTLLLRPRRCRRVCCCARRTPWERIGAQCRTTRCTLTRKTICTTICPLSTHHSRVPLPPHPKSLPCRPSITLFVAHGLPRRRLPQAHRHQAACLAVAHPHPSATRFGLRKWTRCRACLARRCPRCATPRRRGPCACLQAQMCLMTLGVWCLAQRLRLPLWWPPRASTLPPR
jgi:hypothetical protein